MKLTVSRLFDTGFISKGNSFKELGPYFDYQLQLNDNLFRVLINGVNIADNQDATLISASLIPGQQTEIKLGRIPAAVYIGRQNNTAYPITTFVWDVNASANLLATITTADIAFTNPITVTLVVHFS